MLKIFQGIVNIFPKFGLSLLWLIYPRKRRQCSFKNRVSYQIFHSFLVNHHWSGSLTLSSFFYCFDLPFLKKPGFILTATKCFFFNLRTSLWSSANLRKWSNTLKQRRIVWVCLTILWYWRLKKYTTELVMNTSPIARHFHYHNVFIVRNCIINLQR